MGADTRVTLGSFAFSRLEVPEEIPFGGSQRLVTHQLVGGGRVIDAMGRDDMSLAWTGLFFGSEALERARYLDSLRVAGKPLALLWSELNYTVLIEDFKCSFQRFYKLPYSISCVVLQDNAAPVASNPASSFDDAINGDFNLANGFAGQIGDSALTGLMSTLGTAIQGVSTFAGAAKSVINSVAIPLSAVITRVGILAASVNNTVASVTTLGGILPNTPISQSAAKLLQQSSALTQLPILRNLQAVTGRMAGNLGLINSVPNAQVVTVAGGNLYTLASQYYGDPTMWPTIAQANGLTDPQLVGLQTITIPPKPAVSAGGVLSA